MLGQIALGTVPIEAPGGALKIGDTMIIASTGEREAAAQMAAAAQRSTAR